MKKALLVIVLIVLFAALVFRRTSGYAPPRDENTIPPFIEPSKNYPPADNQSNVFIDAGGWRNMREHPLTPFIQGDAYSNVQSFGDFVGLESSSGGAPMYVIAADEQYEYSGSSLKEKNEYIPSITSPAIPFIGAGQQVSSTSQ
jgi:hypothetical protein